MFLKGEVLADFVQGSPEYLLQEVVHAFENGRYSEVEESLERFLSQFGELEKDKKSLEKVYRVLCLSKLKQKKFEESLSCLEFYVKTFPQGKEIEVLSFYRGVALLRVNQGEKAFSVFKEFLEKFPSSQRVEEVRLNQLHALVEDEKIDEAFSFLSSFFDSLSKKNQRDAQLFLIHRLRETSHWKKTVELVIRLGGEISGMEKAIEFSWIALDMGDRLMSEREFRKALRIFQQTKTKEKLVHEQQKRIQVLEKQKTTLVKSIKDEGDKNHSFRVSQIDRQLNEMREALKTLQEWPEYNTVIFFRISRCFYELGRYRESYLMTKHMVKGLPSSEMVMNANYQMLISLTKMSRWGEVVEAAEVFMAKFPKSRWKPYVFYLQGESFMRLKQFEDARNCFLKVTNEFPEFEQKERCSFLVGYTILAEERYREAVKYFQNHQKEYSQGRYLETSEYWEAMAYHFDANYQTSYEKFQSYLKKHPKGEYEEDVLFRKGQALFNLKKFERAGKELKHFIKKFPDAERKEEAIALLGDGYFALGNLKKGVETFQKVSRQHQGFYDYAYFRIGKAYELEREGNKKRKVLKHFQKFVDENPKSPRLSEALSKIAREYQVGGERKKAEQIYWETLKKYGNVVEAVGVEQILKELKGFNKSEKEKRNFEKELQILLGEAIKKKQRTLASRICWISLRKSKNPSWDVVIKTVGDLRQLPPLILAETGDGFRKEGNFTDAEMCYETLLSWWPHSLYQDRAYAGLGLIEYERYEKKGKKWGKSAKKAFHYFDLFEKKEIKSPLLSEVLSAKAQLYLHKKKYEEAVVQLEKILSLKQKQAKGRVWVKALYQIGEIRMSQKEYKKAIPYFQRIYILYGKWPNYVAKAYWQSAVAFERMKMKEEAMATYRELVSRSHLSGEPEYKKALKQIEKNKG